MSEQLSSTELAVNADADETGRVNGLVSLSRMTEPELKPLKAW